MSTTLDDLYYSDDAEARGLSEELSVSVQNDEYQRLKREGKLDPPDLSLNDWLLRENLEGPPQSMREWAYSGDAQRVQTYETAVRAADWLLEYWDTKGKEPTLPCPLWKRRANGSRQAVRPRMKSPDADDFGVSIQEAQTLMSAHHERDIEIREAQVNHEPTVPFHFSESHQDGTTYYIQGNSSGNSVPHATVFYPRPYNSNPTLVSFPIPTPPQQFGVFHERIAFSINTTSTWPPASAFTATATVTSTAPGCSDPYSVTINDAYYMQNGNWSGPYSVTVPGTVMYTVTSNSTATDIFRPPQFDNVYNMGMQAPQHLQPVPAPLFQGAYVCNGNRIQERQQMLWDTPECDFERIVNRHEIEIAYINSKKLLKAWLRPEEYYSLTRLGYMIVPSKLYPDVDYWVYDDDHVYVDAFDHHSTRGPFVVERYCIHSTESRFQKWDKILSKVLLLKADETEFLRRANKHGGDLQAEIPRRH